MFHTPRASLSIRLGAAQPVATGRIYDFTSKFLTVDKIDYLGLSGAIDLDVMLTRRLALQFGTALSPLATGGLAALSLSGAFVFDGALAWAAAALLLFAARDLVNRRL